MRRVVLVRHARITVDPGVAARAWQLSEAGRRAASRLAAWPGWQDVSAVAASDEPKAVATAEPLAIAANTPLTSHPGLREVDRGRTPVLGRAQYVALVRGYLGGAPVPGWEPRATAHARFHHALAEIASAASGPVAVVSHGLVLALYLGLRPDEWERIALPALAVADLDTSRLLEPFRGADELLAESRVTPRNGV